MINLNIAKLALFAGGVFFGTAGVSVLSSKDAKNVYTECTAAVLRGKDSVMKTAATIKENCGDIYADAQAINEARAEAEKKLKIEKAKALLEEAEKEAAQPAAQADPEA